MSVQAWASAVLTSKGTECAAVPRRGSTCPVNAIICFERAVPQMSSNWKTVSINHLP